VGPSPGYDRAEGVDSGLATVAAKRPLSHSRALLLASRAAHGDVSMEEMRLLAAHLRDCESCARHVRELVALLDALARTARRARRPK